MIASLLGALIIVGGVWNLVKARRKNKAGEQSDESEESDTDSNSMDLDLQNTDLESRVDTISRARSRAPSYSRSRRRSPGSVRTARTWSPSPPDSLVDDNDKV